MEGSLTYSIAGFEKIGVQGDFWAVRRPPHLVFFARLLRRPSTRRARGGYHHFRRGYQQPSPEKNIRWAQPSLVIKYGPTVCRAYVCI